MFVWAFLWRVFKQRKKNAMIRFKQQTFSLKTDSMSDVFSRTFDSAHHFEAAGITWVGMFYILLRSFGPWL